jgi:signal transduction histidine kinase
VVAVRLRPGPAYDADDRDFFQNLVDRAALAIDNARLYVAARTSVMLRDEFIHAASHELRTPVTPLKVRLQLLADQVRSARGFADKGPIQRLVEGALRDLERLVRLITDMVAFSRLEAGDLELATEELDLVALVHDVVRALEPELASAGCTVEVGGVPRLVGWWDVARLRQVVVALITNAMKFGAGHPIDVTIGREGDVARLSVRDRGLGVSTVDQARIFERFVRAVPTRHFGGLGLGLYLVRRVVEAHGGAVRLRSAPGEGSTFEVELPVRREEGAAGG